MICDDQIAVQHMLWIAKQRRVRFHFIREFEERMPKVVQRLEDIGHESAADVRRLHSALNEFPFECFDRIRLLVEFEYGEADERGDKAKVW